MDYKILGKDLKVSAVGLGCMGMSHAYGSPADKNEMCELITKAVDLGYNFFDTAEIYGTANNPLQDRRLSENRLKARLKDLTQTILIYTISTVSTLMFLSKR